MSYTAHDYLAYALNQKGDRYIFGAEESPVPDDPGDKWDCSELTSVDDNHLGGHLPDGAQNQYLYGRQHGTLISVDQAIGTPASLLLMGRYTGKARSVHHVAISQGNGLTIEARGHLFGVNVFSAHRGFTYGMLLPTCDYRAKVPPITTPAGTLHTEPIVLRLGSKGKGVEFGRAMLDIVNAHWPLGNHKPLGPGTVYDAAMAARVTEFEHWANKLDVFLWETAGSHPPKPALLLSDGVMTDNTNKRLAKAVKAALA